MKTKSVYLFSSLVGMMCGFISSHTLFSGSWLAIIFWGVVGLALGFFVNETAKASWCGVLFGLFLTVIFLLAGFQGTANNLPGFLLLTLVLSFVGMAGGAISVLSGRWLRRHFTNPNN
jgi:hypothetical protein